MILIKDKLKEANKTTSDYLNWLEDGRKEHEIKNLEGIEAVITKRNGGSANEIYIHENLMDNFNEFLNQ